MKKSHLRALSMVAALLIGILLPQAYRLNFLIRFFLIAMVFISFLRMKAPHQALRPSHLLLAGATLAMGPASWAAVYLFTRNYDLAMAAFFAGITPTATAAPVITGFLNGKQEYVVIAFIVNTLAVALGIPFILPFFLPDASPNIVWDVFGSMTLVIGLPLALALLYRACRKDAEVLALKLADTSFVFWVCSLFLIAANAAHSIRDGDSGGLGTLLGCGFVALLVCIANFVLGYYIGGREFRREASQALGQKNTALMIYLALVYANPVVALGPTCYVFWHNLWNAIQISRQGATPHTFLRIRKYLKGKFSPRIDT